MKNLKKVAPLKTKLVVCFLDGCGNTFYSWKPFDFCDSHRPDDDCYLRLQHSLIKYGA
jgi:hypothetical protein